MPATLTEAERADLPDRLPGWRRVDGRDAIARDWRFRDFNAAWGFLCRVALLAERADHHPDWSNSYDKVSIVLTTHDAGGVTAQDVALAEAIDALDVAHAPGPA